MSASTIIYRYYLIISSWLQTNRFCKNDERHGGRGVMKKWLSVLGEIFFYLLVGAIVGVIVMNIIGFRFFTVQTGSMANRYPVGTVIVIQPTDFEQFSVDDVITFRIENTDTVVTHRIISIDEKNQTVQTKGDNNNTADNGAIENNEIVGKVVFSVPYVGYVMIFLNTWVGKIVLGVIVLGDVLYFVIRQRSDKRKDEI